MKYGNFEVYLKDTSVGEIEITEEGIRTHIKCRARCDSNEILRLAADVDGRYECIGVMMPREKSLYLEKTFTKNDVFKKGLDKAARYVLVSENTQYEKKAEEKEEKDVRGWRNCADPMKYFDDIETGAALSRFEGILKAEEDGVTYIAVPIDKEKAFPALPVFYFGQQEKLGGREFVVFTLKDGQLMI